MSDAAPEARISPGNWTARPWQDVARDALASGDAAHLSVLDGDGFPLPMRARSATACEEGFELDMPRGTPWKLEGEACLTFAGFRTFVGEAVPHARGVLFRAERALPQHPSTLDTKQVLQPAEATLAKTRARLEAEMARLGQPLPVIPAEPPKRTRLAKLRMQRLATNAPITGITVEHGNRTT